MNLTGGYTEYDDNSVDYHLTYSEEEKQEIEEAKANSNAIFTPEFIPFYIKEVKELGLTPIEGLVYGFIRFYMKNNSGRFYFSNNQLAEILGTAEQTMKNTMAKLKKLGVIETGTKVKAGGGTIRFIKGFSPSTLQSTCISTSKVPNQVLSYKENKINNIYKPQTSSKFEEHTFEYKVSKHFYKLKEESLIVQGIINNDKQGLEGVIQKGAAVIDKLKRIDKYNEAQIKAILAFLFEDDFWNKNIFSLEKLRKKNKDGIPYFLILAQKYDNLK